MEESPASQEEQSSGMTKGSRNIWEEDKGQREQTSSKKGLIFIWIFHLLEFLWAATAPRSEQDCWTNSFTFNESMKHVAPD